MENRKLNISYLRTWRCLAKVNVPINKKRKLGPKTVDYVFLRYVSAFRDRGVPKPTSECAACPSPDGSSAWASVKGGEARWPESSVREV
jgi:hypothetical protein